MGDLRVVYEALKRFPNLRPILTMPGIAQVLDELARDGYGWSAEQLQARLEQTPYWQNSTDSQRNWDALRVLDPATAQQRWDAGARHVHQLHNALGLTLTPEQIAWITAVAIPHNYSDDLIKAMLLDTARRGSSGLPTGGDLGAAFTQVKNLANDYAVTVSDSAAYNHAIDLLQGYADAPGLADTFRNYAVSQYGSNKTLVDALNRGVTVKDYADPYIQTAVQELGINPAAVSLTSTKWNRFLTDLGSSGESGLSLQDWTRTLRTDASYGYNRTAGAADQASQLVSALAREFGVTG